MTEIRVGAEPWSYHPGDERLTADVGVLVLHGFTGNCSAVRPVAEAAAEAGHAVEMPLLPGHGTTWQDLARTTWRQWAARSIDALELLARRSRRQIVVGLSMGGTLALHLAETRGDSVAGVALINPAVQTRDPRLKLLPVLKWVLPSLPGIASDIADPEQHEMAYERVPLRALASMLELQRHVRTDLHRITQPLLVLTSTQDHVVDPRDSTTIVEQVASDDVEQIRLERSYHVATLDYDAGTVLQETLAFIDRVTR